MEVLARAAINRPQPVQVIQAPHYTSHERTPLTYSSSSKIRKPEELGWCKMWGNHPGLKYGYKSKQRDSQVREDWLWLQWTAVLLAKWDCIFCQTVILFIYAKFGLVLLHQITLAKSEMQAISWNILLILCNLLICWSGIPLKSTQ